MGPTRQIAVNAPEELIQASRKMIVSALLQREGNRTPEPEIRSLASGFENRGVQCTYFLEKQIRRRNIAIDRNTVVAGHIPVVLSALRQLGIEPPVPDDYPASLKPWLHRRTWTSTVRDVVRQLQEGISKPFFAKPLGRHKRFRGHVFQSWEDMRMLGGASDSTTVHCSEVVEWESEFRVYVVRGSIVGTGHYAGDLSNPINVIEVKAAVRRFQDFGQAPAGYGIDFGVLSTGQTALVEVNDGYSLGAYNVSDDAYTDLIVARWEQLVMSDSRSTGG